MNETRHKITLLPNSVNNTTNVSIFTEKEALIDLVENGKFNKRQVKKIKNEIAKKRNAVAFYDSRFLSVIFTDEFAQQAKLLQLNDF